MQAFLVILKANKVRLYCQVLVRSVVFICTFVHCNRNTDECLRRRWQTPTRLCRLQRSASLAEKNAWELTSFMMTSNDV